MRGIRNKIQTVLFLVLLQFPANAQQKRIYVSNDDHTDYMWTANEVDYDSAFLHMLDWWLDYNDATSANAAPYQSKWNCDGSFWIKSYEKHRSAAQFNRLIDQIRNGKITVPYSPLIVTYGGQPAEAALRGMYYAGELERRFNLDFNMAIAMENQILPLGLSSLWKGAGAKYCWHGVCDCATHVPGSTNRANEIYWYKGLDTNKILLKWYSMQSSGYNQYLGGYAEARTVSNTIPGLSAKINTAAYPYYIAAGFGVGWDDLQTTSDNLVAAAIANSTNPAVQQVIVSNEVDFFQDFENNYGNSLPNVTQTFGNEWELSCASIAEISAKVKRSLEKLRAAEAMAAIVINYVPTFTAPLDSLRKEAWMALGLYWDHDFGAAGNISLDERNLFERRLEITISSYVNQLYTLAKSNLGNLITNDVPSSKRFFVFNPLGWVRTDYADYVYNGSQNIHVKDVTTNTEVPLQFITKNAVNYLRIEADSIPSIGYKVFEILSGPGTAFPPAGTNAGNIVENDFFKVTYTNQGVLTSIIDKQNANKEIALLTNGKYINDLGTGTANVGTSSVEYNGPVSITIVTNTSATPLAHSTRITLFKNVPRIEIDNQITQNFSATNTWAYSFNIASPTVWHEEVGAVIKAKLTNNNGHYATQNARYDWSTLNHFASVNETSYGVTLSNEDCYFMKLGNSTDNSFDENTAQLNVLSGGMLDGWGIANQGNDNIFNQRFAITTHNAYSASAEMKKALEHQNSFICDSVYNPVNFLLPNYYSFVNNSDSGSLIWAIKPAEDGVDNAIITRVWNLKNTDATPTLEFRLSINSARRTTHVETDMNSNPFNLKSLLTTIGHNEMKTFRVKLDIIPLPIKLISFAGEKHQDFNYIKWEITNEINLIKYELERSTDGQQFIKITTVFTKQGTTNSYEYSDKNVNAANVYYYRLKMINNNNSFGYSNIIIIKAAKDAANLILYPNPVVDLLKVSFVLDKQIRCNLAVLNSAGAIVKTVSPPLFERGNNYYTLSLKELPAAEYLLSITAGDKKFVKNFFKK